MAGPPAFTANTRRTAPAGVAGVQLLGAGDGTGLGLGVGAGDVGAGAGDGEAGAGLGDGTAGATPRSYTCLIQQSIARPLCCMLWIWCATGNA
jgi:hypothetical protein